MKSGSGDGSTDLSLKFLASVVVNALELGALSPGDLVELVLSGNLLDGTEFEASDCVRLVPPGTPPGYVLVGSNLPGVWIDVAPLDDQLDSGGFTSYHRTFPQTTLVTVTAPIFPASYPRWVLHSWLSTATCTPWRCSTCGAGGPSVTSQDDEVTADRAASN